MWNCYSGDHSAGTVKLLEIFQTFAQLFAALLSTNRGNMRVSVQGLGGLGDLVTTDLMPLLYKYVMLTVMLFI